MDYKKRNEEILEKLRTLRDSWASTNNRAAKEIEEAIPELIESEDEKIRKEIIDFATKANNGVTSILANNYNFNKWIALLEKRAEQKPAEWSEDDREYMKSLLDIINGTPSLTPSEVECHKDWLKSLKDKVIPQPMQEWSEEDDRMRSLTIHYIREYQLSDRCKTTIIEDMETSDACEDWLKSLRPQNHWKPSEEQMEALEHFIVYHNGSTNYAKDLEELRLQLKKLMEE